MSTINGGSGNDSLTGTSGNDTIRGNDGNDTIGAGAGNDSVSGGAGHDSVTLGDGNDTFGDWSEPGNDTVDGGAGDDLIIGGEGSDQLSGGSGNDSLSGGAGNDTLSGGDGMDTFWVTDDHNYDSIHGGAGGTDWDAIYFANWQSAAGVDVSFSGTGTGSYRYAGTNGRGDFAEIEGLGGTDYADTLDGSRDTGGLSLYGNGGNDTITGGSGADRLSGGTGNDSVRGGAGSDVLSGDAGNDTLSGDDGDDVLEGHDGSDSLLGGAGNDYLVGYDIRDESQAANRTTTPVTVSDDGADDYLDGGTGNDTLLGGGGRDTLLGGDGNDVLLGGAGADSASGGLGDDTLDGGAGSDTLTGGGGSDRFVLSAGSDVITDFSNAVRGSDGRYLDRLDASALRDASGGPVTRPDILIGEDAAGNAVLRFPNGETVTLQGISAAQAGQPLELWRMGIPCFTTGTRIATPAGEIPVERIVPGDTVLTTDGPQPVLWAGRRALPSDLLTSSPDLRPVRIAAGAAGNRRPLVISPQHAVVLCDRRGQGRLVRALHLAEFRPDAAQVLACRTVAYHHLLLPRHAILLAEGVPAESLYPGPRVRRMLGPEAWSSVCRAVPRLAWLGDEGTLDTVEALYGPRALPLLDRREARRLLRHPLRTPGFPTAAPWPVRAERRPTLVPLHNESPPAPVTPRETMLHCPARVA